MKRTLLALHLPVSRGRADTGEDHTPRYGGTRQKTCVYEWPTETVSFSLSLSHSHFLSLILTVWGVRVCVSACLSLSHTHTRQPIHPPYDDALGVADGSESEHLNCVPHTLPWSWNRFPLTRMSAEGISNVLTVSDNKNWGPERIIYEIPQVHRQGHWSLGRLKKYGRE